MHLPSTENMVTGSTRDDRNKSKSNIQNNNEYFYILAFIPSLKSVLFGSQMTIECYGKVATKAMILTI